MFESKGAGILGLNVNPTPQSLMLYYFRLKNIANIHSHIFLKIIELDIKL
jgi:hypothetical protein